MLAVIPAPPAETQWTVQRAQQWSGNRHWRTGCNFTPSTAINQLEMWQTDTFDSAAFDREFGWMHDVGMSAARIFLHDLAYEADPKGFKNRMRTVLQLAAKHGIRVMFVIFDDCWLPNARVGKQPEPRPGVHNSGWLRSPSDDLRHWPEDLPRLKTYVLDILSTFAKDRRIWMWDLYNEPGNSNYGDKSLPLLRAVFEWGHQVRPSQPLTAGAFEGGQTPTDKACTELSDVVTFHCYGGLDDLRTQVAFYKSLGRPVICTEWMARTAGSTIATHLPVFRQEGVSCLQWGFVSGRTNTIFPWGSKENSPEPPIWFHDLRRKDGTPFDPAEVALYRKLGGR